MRLLNERAGDDRAVLEHVLEVDEVAVVHVLRKIVGVMEVDDAGLVRVDDLLRQEHPRRQVFGNFARHIVALDGVDGRVLVGVFLLDFFVVRFDQRQDFFVGRVALADERTGIAVGDVLLGDLIGPVRHDLVLDQILNFFDAQGTVHPETGIFHAFGDAADLHRRQLLVLLDDVVGLRDGGDDLHDIEDGLRTVPLDDFHAGKPLSVPGGR